MRRALEDQEREQANEAERRRTHLREVEQRAGTAASTALRHLVSDADVDVVVVRSTATVTQQGHCTRVRLLVDNRHTVELATCEPRGGHAAAWSYVFPCAQVGCDDDAAVHATFGDAAGLARYVLDTKPRYCFKHS